MPVDTAKNGEYLFVIGEDEDGFFSCRQAMCVGYSRNDLKFTADDKVFSIPYRNAFTDKDEAEAEVKKRNFGVLIATARMTKRDMKNNEDYTDKRIRELRNTIESASARIADLEARIATLESQPRPAVGYFATIED